MHAFLFTPGVWLGEGTVSFSVSPEKVRFYTKWTVEAMDASKTIYCEQIVEMQGVEEKVVNKYAFSCIEPSTFTVLLNNETIEKVTGTGVVDDTKIAWEFRDQEAFEGFEVFERNSEGDYLLHAEFASPDQFRTIIDGKIWPKEGDSSS